MPTCWSTAFRRDAADSVSTACPRHDDLHQQMIVRHNGRGVAIAGTRGRRGRWSHSPSSTTPRRGPPRTTPTWSRHGTVPSFLSSTDRCHPDTCRPWPTADPTCRPTHIPVFSCVHSCELPEMQPQVHACCCSMQHVFRLSHDDIAELDAAVHKATAAGKEIAVCVQHQHRHECSLAQATKAPTLLHLSPDSRQLGKPASAEGSSCAVLRRT